MTVTDLAAVTGLGWDTVKNILKARLEKDYGHPRLKELRRLSIDEIHLGRRQKFYTLVIDLDTGRIVWVAKGRGGEALRKFWRALRLSKARIEAVAMDMTEAHDWALRYSKLSPEEKAQRDQAIEGLMRAIHGRPSDPQDGTSGAWECVPGWFIYLPTESECL